GHVVGAKRCDGTANWYQNIEGEAPVGDDAGTEEGVATVALHHRGGATGAEVVHEAHVRVGDVDQVAVAVSAGDQHDVDGRVGQQQVLRLLQRQDRRAALLPQVVRVGVAGADVVGELDARGPDRVLLVLLGDGDDDVDLLGRDAGVGQRDYGGVHAHRGGVVVGH